MGVSGCGKSTIGKLLSKELNFNFFDGDDYHPEANVQKMASGQPLNDDDRKGWLITLNKLAIDHVSTGAVIACSALKDSYRQLLQKDIIDHAQFVFLEGSFQEIMGRLQERTEHFMPPALLESQFSTLETPQEALIISIQLTPGEIVNKIVAST